MAELDKAKRIAEDPHATVTYSGKASHEARSSRAPRQSAEQRAAAKAEAKAKAEAYAAALSAPPAPVDLSAHPLVAKAVAGSMIPDVSGNHKVRGPILDKTELSRNLLSTDLFASMATQIEDIRLKPYPDMAAGGKITLGIGYCIDARYATFAAKMGKAAAKEKIIDDLSHAGLSRVQSEALMRHDKAAVRDVRITPEGALALLEHVKPEYQQIAKDAVGEAAWNKLPENKQAALTYRTYNTGRIPASLAKAVAKGDNYSAMLGDNFLPYYRPQARDESGNPMVDENGKPIRERKDNHRARAWMQAAWLGGNVIAKAIDKPGAFEGTYANESATAALASLAMPKQNVRDRLQQGRKKKHDAHDHGHDNDVAQSHEQDHAPRRAHKA